MLKTAHPGGLIPPTLHPAPHDRHDRHVRPDRPTTLLFAGALASFGLALMLAGAAACIAAGAPVPADLDQSLFVFGALAAACALAALGMALALRERSLRAQQLRRATRAEQIQEELDGLGLTPKEMPIAKLILQHQSYAAIAANRHLAVRTVQFHATNIFRKAYVSNRRDFERVILADERPACDERATDESRESACDDARQQAFRDNQSRALACRVADNSKTLACRVADSPSTNALVRNTGTSASRAAEVAPTGEQGGLDPDPSSPCPTTLRSRAALRQNR